MRQNGQATTVRQHTIPGGWKEYDYVIGGRAFRLLLPAAPNEFLDQLDETPPGPDEVDPYWVQIWPCARIMAEVVRRADWDAEQGALEVGCGVGLVGLAALARGLPVTFSDSVPLAVDLAVENAHRNGLTQARGRVLDWRRPGSERYPLIFGCDVLYERPFHEPLLNTLDQMLTDDGVAWIGDPVRYHAEAFVQLVRRRGFALQAYDAEGNRIDAAAKAEFQMFRIQRSRSSALPVVSCRQR